MATDETNLVDVIIADHRSVEEVFQELEQGSGTPQHRRQLADHVIAELVRHSVAKEQYMYPAAREALPDGDEVVDHELAEHAEAEQVMNDLDDVDPEDPRFNGLLAALMADVRHHIEEEETDLLPKLQQACSQERLQQLGAQVLEVRSTAPTRPHPNTPSTPPANRILDP